MPPKGSGRNRKKVETVEVSKNGSDAHKEDVIKVTKKNNKEVDDSKETNGVSPLDGKAEPIAKRGKRKAEVKNDEALTKAEESNENGKSNEKETVDETAVVSKRGRKKDEVKSAEHPPKESVISDENGSGEETAGASKRGRKKASDKNSETVVANGKSEEAAVPKRGRKKAEAVSTSVEEKDLTVDAPDSEDKKEVTHGKQVSKKADKVDKTDVVSDESNEDVTKKGGQAKKVAAMSTETVLASGRGRKRKIPEKQEKTEDLEMDEGEVQTSAMSTETESKPTLLASGRGRKRKIPEKEDKTEDLEMDKSEDQTTAVSTETESKPTVPASGRGRKRKSLEKEEKTEDLEIDESEAGKSNAKESVKSVSRGRKKKNDEEKTVDEAEEKKSESQLDKNRQLRVELVRNEKLDKIAESEMKSAEEEPKTKSAKGPKSVAKGKRAMQSAEESKPAKKAKETSSKPKKDKIPDVTALDFNNESKTADGKEWNLKISSWNVNGIRAWLEKDGMSYLHHEKPDVMCVQETKCSDDKLPSEANVEGYHCYWLAGDKDGYSGVGLLSKEKPISIEYGIGIEEHDNEGRVITAEYDSFYLVSTYVPNAGRGLVRLNYRMKWDVDFCAYLKKLDAKKPVVLCGDLNVAHEEIDLANPKTNKKNAGFTQEERDGFSALLSEGFVDTFRHLYPDQKSAYTFWTYMMNARAKNVGWRLDYFVISKKLCDHLCDSVIRKDVFGSDHCPVSLFLHI